MDFAADSAAGRKKIGARRNDICFVDLKLNAKPDDKSGLELVPLAAKALQPVPCWSVIVPAPPVKDDAVLTVALRLMSLP